MAAWGALMLPAAARGGLPLQWHLGLQAICSAVPCFVVGQKERLTAAAAHSPQME
jgi:hypothetical protein